MAKMLRTSRGAAAQLGLASLLIVGGVLAENESLEGSALAKLDEAEMATSGAPGRLPWCRKAAVLTPFSDSELLLFSGKGHDHGAQRHGSTYLGDTWALDLSYAFSDPVANAVWHELEPPIRDDDGGARPVGRWKTAGDFMDGALYVYNGDAGGTFLADAWRARRGGSDDSVDAKAPDVGAPGSIVWTQLDATPRTEEGAMAVMPDARRGHTMTASPTHGVLVVVGGRKAHHVCLNDVWILSPDGTSNELAVTAGAPFPGPCRWGHSGSLLRLPPGAASLDYSLGDGEAEQEVVAIFGGRQKVDGHMVYHDDLWFYDVAGDAWHLAVQASDTFPAARDHHAAAAVGSLLYIHGGRTMEKATHALNDLWVYDSRTGLWRFLDPLEYPGKAGTAWAAGKPMTRYLHSAAVWEGQVLLFGGEHLRSSAKHDDDKLNDLWLYKPPGVAGMSGDGDGEWRQLTEGHCSGLTTAPLTPAQARALMCGSVIASAVLTFILIFANKHQDAICGCCGRGQRGAIGGNKRFSHVSFPNMMNANALMKKNNYVTIN